MNRDDIRVETERAAMHRSTKDKKQLDISVHRVRTTSLCLSSASHHTSVSGCVSSRAIFPVQRIDKKKRYAPDFSTGELLSLHPPLPFGSRWLLGMVVRELGARVESSRMLFTLSERQLLDNDFRLQSKRR